MRRLASPAWLLRHVAMIVLVAVFLRLGWWQIGRAEGGNGLSVGYSLEWPAFAIFVIVVWAREVRGALAADRAQRPGGTAGTAATDGVAGPQPGASVDVPAGVSVFDVAAARTERAERTRRELDLAEAQRSMSAMQAEGASRE